MKSRITITSVIIILICAVNYSSKSQAAINSSVAQTQIEIEAINNKIEQLYISKNANSLIRLYTKELAFLPEYKPAIFNIEELKRFFSDWFKAGDIKAYKKKIYRVEVYGDYILEMGTFMMNYLSRHQLQGEYNGKYMVVWRNGNGKKLSIVSETFGANKYLEPEDVPFADVKVEASNFVAKNNVSKQLQKEVEEFNAKLLKAVAEGDANTRANGFTNDAILMASFDSTRVGMNAILTKMFKTYTPETSYKVKHTYNRILDLGDYVFITAHYEADGGIQPTAENLQVKCLA